MEAVNTAWVGRPDDSVASGILVHANYALVDNRSEAAVVVFGLCICTDRRSWLWNLPALRLRRLWVLGSVAACENLCEIYVKSSGFIFEGI